MHDTGASPRRRFGQHLAAEQALTQILSSVGDRGVQHRQGHPIMHGTPLWTSSAVRLGRSPRGSAGWHTSRTAGRGSLPLGYSRTNF